MAHICGGGRGASGSWGKRFPSLCHLVWGLLFFFRSLVLVGDPLLILSGHLLLSFLGGAGVLDLVWKERLALATYYQR